MDQIWELIPILSSEEVEKLAAFLTEISLNQRDQRPEIKNDILNLFTSDLDGISYTTMLSLLSKKGWDFDQILTKLNEMILNGNLTIHDESYYLPSNKQTSDNDDGSSNNNDNDYQTDSTSDDDDQQDAREILFDLRSDSDDYSSDDSFDTTQ
jgi:hypothetical protein